MAGGAILNMILDPIFIFALDMGIKGAAIASTISIFCMAVVSILHFVQPSSFIRFKAHAWKPKGYIFKNITMIGMSPFLMNLAAAGVVAILNSQLLRYGGDYAVGAYGICNTYGNFLVLVIIGVCQGMQPIAGYNYGAGHGHRLKHVYGLTMWICVAIGFVGSVISCLIPGTMMRAFTTDPHLIELGRVALRYSMVMFPLIGFTIVNSNFFQAIDKPWVAIVTSLSRQVIFLVPMSLLIPLLYVDFGWNGLNGVWISLTISDVLGAVLAAILLFTQRQVFSISDNKNSIST
jgi:Na+-driven multidrug efflux pump